MDLFLWLTSQPAIAISDVPVSWPAGLWATHCFWYSELCCYAEQWGGEKLLRGRSQGPHTLAWVRLLLRVFIPTYNWKPRWSSGFRAEVDLLFEITTSSRLATTSALWGTSMLVWSTWRRRVVEGDFWLWQLSGALCCWLSWEQWEEGSQCHRAAGWSVPRQWRAGPLTECRYGNEMLGKDEGAHSHSRQAQLPAWRMTDLSPITDALFNNRLTEFFWAFLMLKGHWPKQLKGQPTYPILGALFDLLFLWHCLGYPPPAM